MELYPLKTVIYDTVKGYLDNGGPIRRLGFALMLVAGWLYAALASAEDVSRINQVKAAFVLNIARFVSWPDDAIPNPNENMRLCLYRDNPIGQAISSIDGEKVGGHDIAIQHIQSLRQSGSCNILLITERELKHYREEAPASPSRPLLTIADLTETEASMPPHDDILITLIRNGARIGFEINLEKSRRAGLRMSSELLKLAIIVDDGH